MREVILRTVDIFYPLFRKLLTLADYRYLAIGGSTWLFGNIFYAICYQYVFTSEIIDFEVFSLKRENAALALNLLVLIPLSFILNRNVVFTHSKVKMHVQFVRFSSLAFINVVLNFYFLNFTINQFHLNPILAKIIISIALGLFSYIYQQYFTFKVKTFQQSTP